MSTSYQGPIVRYNEVAHPTRVLVKHVEINEDGSVSKGRGGQIPAGCTVSTKTAPLGQYVHDAFYCGTSKYILPANCELGDATPITSKDFPIDGGVDRTSQTLKYVTGPAVLTFDHDPHPRSPLVLSGPDALHKLLSDLLPTVFAMAAYGGYDSSGSYIYDTDGNQVSGRRGFHVAFAVCDATCIREAAVRLFKLLWLADFGYIAVTRDGKAIPRTVFDMKVVEPQQPLFAGGAHCVNAVQRRPDPIWQNGGYLNLAEVPHLSHAEEREYLRKLEAAKAEAKPECDLAKCEYTRQSVEKLVHSGGIPVGQAKQIVASRMGGTLVGNDRVNFDAFGWVSVAEVLRDPKRYDNATLADPIDGDVCGKAIFFANAESGIPLIYSHAHGGGKFFLKHDLSSLLSWVAATSRDEVLDQWLNDLPGAALRKDEHERYLAAVKDKTGISITVLRAAAKDASRMAAAVANASLTEDPGLFLAKRLLDQHYQGGANLLALESGYFWHYTGTHWEQIKETVLEGLLQNLATELWDQILKMWDVFGKKPSTLAALLSSAVTCLQNLVVVPGDPLRLNSTRPSVINCSNGEVWLLKEGAELRAHSPNSYLTSCSTIEYDPSAKAPTFEIAIRGILSFPGGDPMPDQDEMVRHVEELMGYTIQTRRNLKMFVLIVGPGDNGKTKLVKLLTLIMGMDAIAFDRLAGVDESGNRFAAGRLVGKLALVDDDVDFEYLLPDGLLKKIAEEKPLTAEGKFKDHFSFVAQIVPWLLGNSWPRSRDLTRGMQTRANVLHLPRSFLRPSECGENHPDRQRPGLWDNVYGHEMSGVLNRLIAGYYRVAERDGFQPPKSAQKAFDMWIADANVVARFVAEACQPIDPGKSGFTTTEGYEAFICWCDQNGVQQKHRPQANQFKKRLEDLGIKVSHTEKGTGVFGYGLMKEWRVIRPHQANASGRSLRTVG
ncbi:MAG: hypothetical protein IPF44_10635 [Betaproteobacteria bacterium]|nr:hypothetical protein [Betaproteobacteria bacterium]